MIIKRTLLIVEVLFIVFGLNAQEPDDDHDIRIGGVSEAEVSESTGYEDIWEIEEHVTIPGYISQEAIIMNDVDWSDLARKLRQSIDVVSVVHIGDSHMQADIATQYIRECMQLEFGNAGRGLVAPLRLSGTNEPFNYIFRSDIAWHVDKFMKYPWHNSMGFTGCGLYSPAPKGYVEIATSEKLDYNPFTEIRLYFSGSLNIASLYDENGSELGYDYIPNSKGGVIRLALPTNHVKISIESSEPVSLYGAYLSAGKPGIVYNVIGNNGATYSTYNRISNFGFDISVLNPDLVIVSLGCNEAFGVFNALAFTHQVEMLIDDIRRENPDAYILLTTPMECHKRTTTRVRRGKGKHRRTVALGSYSRNTRIAEVRNAIMAYGHSHGIPVYDFYAVAGGAGSSDKWIADGLFSRDHIHLSSKGYKLMGRLFTDALLQQLRP